MPDSIEKFSSHECFLQQTLSICVALCESGVNPEALSDVIKELRREASVRRVSFVMVVSMSDFKGKVKCIAPLVHQNSLSRGFFRRIFFVSTSLFPSVAVVIVRTIIWIVVTAATHDALSRCMTFSTAFVQALRLAAK